VSADQPHQNRISVGSILGRETATVAVAVAGDEYLNLRRTTAGHSLLSVVATRRIYGKQSTVYGIESAYVIIHILW
jgi:hypothetical protein